MFINPIKNINTKRVHTHLSDSNNHITPHHHRKTRNQKRSTKKKDHPFSKENLWKVNSIKLRDRDSP